MQVFQTAGVPPASGRTIFANIGCTRKSSAALTKRVVAKSRTIETLEWNRRGWLTFIVPRADA